MLYILVLQALLGVTGHSMCLLSVCGDSLLGDKSLALQVIQIELLHQPGGPDLSLLCELEQIVFILLFALLQIQQHFVLGFTLLGEVLIHFFEILLKFMEIVMLLSDEDENIAEQAERKGEVQCFEGELLDFISEARHGILEILEAE